MVEVDAGLSTRRFNTLVSGLSTAALFRCALRTDQPTSQPSKVLDGAEAYAHLQAHLRGA